MAPLLSTHFLLLNFLSASSSVYNFCLICTILQMMLIFLQLFWFAWSLSLYFLFIYPQLLSLFYRFIALPLVRYFDYLHCLQYLPSSIRHNYLSFVKISLSTLLITNNLRNYIIHLISPTCWSLIYLLAYCSTSS